MNARERVRQAVFVDGRRPHRHQRSVLFRGRDEGLCVGAVRERAHRLYVEDDATRHGEAGRL
jgi:hypothetical protein